MGWLKEKVVELLEPGMMEKADNCFRMAEINSMLRVQLSALERKVFILNRENDNLREELGRQIDILQRENTNLKLWIQDAKVALDGGWDGPTREV